MPNRAERRAAAKRDRRGIPQQYDRTRGRGRSGMLDAYDLQERSRRLVENGTEAWKPQAQEAAPAMIAKDPEDYDPKLRFALKTPSQWLRLVSWVVIALCIIGFFTVMWLPNAPLAAVIAIAGVFAVAVLSLFFITGNSQRNGSNGRLDEHGTAL